MNYKSFQKYSMPAVLGIALCSSVYSGSLERKVEAPSSQIYIPHSSNNNDTLGYIVGFLSFAALVKGFDKSGTDKRKDIKQEQQIQGKGPLIL